VIWTKINSAREMNKGNYQKIVVFIEHIEKCLDLSQNDVALDAQIRAEMNIGRKS
jgi:hypothetical protein